MQKQSAGAEYRWRLARRAPRNKAQNTIVIKTSVAAMGGVNQRSGIDPSGMVVPASVFIAIESDWSKAPQLKRLPGRMEERRT